MRIHGLACGYVVFFALKMGVSRGELACLLLAMGKEGGPDYHDEDDLDFVPDGDDGCGVD